jgi:hypothetical protein
MPPYVRYQYDLRDVVELCNIPTARCGKLLGVAPFCVLTVSVTRCTGSITSTEICTLRMSYIVLGTAPGDRSTAVSCRMG